MIDQKKQLLTLFVRFESSFQSLSKAALSQVIFKIIYIYNTETIKIERIQKEIKQLFNCNVKKKEVLNSIKKLVDDNKIVKENKNYYLTEESKHQIESSIKEYDVGLDEVIKHWFSKIETDFSEIKKWFENLLIKFFEMYSHEYIETILSPQNAKIMVNMESLLEESFGSEIFVVEEDHEFVKNQAMQFFESPRPNDKAFLFTIGSSYLSATMLHSRFFGDDLSFKEFESSNFVLDTNVIFSVLLNNGDSYESFEILEKMLKKIEYYFKLYSHYKARI